MENENKEALKMRLKDYLSELNLCLYTKNGKTKFNCPIHGGDGGNCELRADGTSFYCHSQGCANQMGGTSWDIFNLHGYIRGYTDKSSYEAHFGEIYNELCDKYGLQKEETNKSDKNVEYIKECQRNISHPKSVEFWKKRGFADIQFLNGFGIGYDKAQNVAVLPLNERQANKRYIEHPTLRYALTKDTKKDKCVYFEKTTGTKCIFLTEGQINALSVYAVGGEAVAMMSCGDKNTREDFVKMYKAKKYMCLVVVAFDFDKKGQEGAKELSDLLHKHGIRHTILTELYAEAHNSEEDLNDIFVRGGLADKVAMYERNKDYFIAECKENAIKNSKKILGGYMCGRIEALDIAIANRETPIATGITAIDNPLYGGLRKGLYVIGAECGGGKTALCMQMADNLAMRGNDVIYFSLEMDALELYTRSLSRLCCEIDRRASGATYANDYCLSSIEIRQGSRRNINLAKAENLLTHAKSEYVAIAQNLRVLTMTDIDMSKITEEIEQTITSHISITGNTPVVFLDYLQLCAVSGAKDYRMEVDNVVRELKRMTIERNVAIVVISSLSRANYDSGKTDLGIYKESGLIEYTADACIRLGYDGEQEQKEAYYEEAEKGAPIPFYVSFSKNRYGRGRISTTLKYWVKYQCFGSEWQGDEVNV